MASSIRILVVVLALVASLFISTITTAAHAAQHNPLKAYAYRLAVQHHWTGYQWSAIQEIIGPESNWNPCAYYPSKHDCRYGGSNSCGFPQANPCPREWRGRLWEARYEQVRWFFRYIKRRYHTPAQALAFRRANNWY